MFTLPKSQFASNSWIYSQEPLTHPLNIQLASFYKAIFLAEDGHTPSDYLKINSKIDEQLNQYYFAMPEELAARAFESVVQDQKIKNAYLVSGTQKSEQAELGIFPQTEHRRLLSSSCLGYFQLLGQVYR